MLMPENAANFVHAQKQLGPMRWTEPQQNMPYREQMAL